MKPLALYLRIFIFFVVFFSIFRVYSQSYSRVLAPEKVLSYHKNVNPIVWGCRFCAQPLKYNESLDWEISYNISPDSSENLIDSLILDFNKTPGFDLSSIVLNGNLTPIDSKRVLVLPGTSRINGLKQIDINTVNPQDFIGRETEIEVISINQGRRKLFPVLADILIIPKEIDSTLDYRDIDFGVNQIFDKDTLADFRFFYEMKKIRPYLTPTPIFTNRAAEKLACILDGDRIVSPRTCHIRKITPFILPEIPDSDCLIGTPITQVDIPRFSSDRSLICVEASALTSEEIEDSDDENKLKPILVLDGMKSDPSCGTDCEMNDVIFKPFQTITSNIDGKAYYIFDVPNINPCLLGPGEDCTIIPELFIFNRKNKLCHISIQKGLNGTYVIRLEPRYEPRLKFYKVEEPAAEDWTSIIQADLGFAACFFDDFQTGIDFKSNMHSFSIYPSSDTDLKNKLVDLYENRRTSQKGRLINEFRSEFSDHFSPGTITVYYINPLVENDDGFIPDSEQGDTGPPGGLYVYKDFILIAPGLSTPETLAHELGHSMGLKHVIEGGVLDCNDNDRPDCTTNKNIMALREEGENRDKITLGQIMRIYVRPYSQIRTDWSFPKGIPRICEELGLDPFYRRDALCPCLGFNNNE